MKEILAYRGCFVCGHENKHGLKARFFHDGNEATTTVTATPEFEGYHGIYHGGIVATLLDEVMIKSILAQDIYAVTAEMTVRFRLPARTGVNLTYKGRIIGRKGRMLFTSGTVTDTEGNVIAEASGKYIEAKPELKKTLLQSKD